MSAGRPLSVALVADEDPGWGGIGTYTGVLARGLRDLGHQVHLVLRGWEGDATEQLDGLVVHRVQVPESRWRRGTVAAVSRLYVAREALVFSARVARRVASLARAQGLAVVETPEFHAPGLVAALHSQLLRRPPGVVVRLHTPAYLTAQLDGERRTADLRAQELLELSSVRAAGAVTSPSAALATEVARRWHLRPARVRVLPNPIDAELFAPGGEAPEPGSILVVGRVEPRKGQDILLEALPAICRRVPEARLRLVGADGSDGSVTARLRDRARALGLEDGVLAATGAVARQSLPALYRSASVCVVPSRFDNFPYSCLEAMACGRAVVATGAGGPAEMINHGHDGLLVAPGDSAGFADAVAELLADAGARERLGKAARSTVLRRYATPVIAARTAELYRTLCEAGG